MGSADFFVNQTLDNRAAVDTYTFDPMLFQFCVTTATLINFTQNSDLNKSVYEICLKTTMMESESFLFNKPLLMIANIGKYFQCAARLIFNLFGVIILTSSTPKVKQATLRVFSCVVERKFLREIKAL